MPTQPRTERMTDILFLRRRLMMQSKKSDWIPLMLNCYSDEELIRDYGNLFETYKNAPDEFGAGSAAQQQYLKCGAIAVAQSAATTTIRGNSAAYVRVYEDGVLKGTYYSNVTVTWQSESKARHIITYGTQVTTGNYNNSGIVWILATTQINQVSSVLLQTHYHRDSTSLGYYSSDDNRRRSPLGVYNENAIMYYPERWNNGGNRVQFWYKRVPTIVVPKYGALTTDGYFVYHAPVQFKHMYVRWGLGEVPNKGNWVNFWASNSQRYYTLHIPDLGNPEDNTALMDEYISKNWKTNSGSGTVITIVHSNLPENPYL